MGFLAAVQTGQGISFAPWPSFRLATPDRAGALKQLEDNGSFVPEGLRLYFRASLKLHPKIKDKESGAKDLERAAELPALFPVCRICLLGLAAHKIGLAKKGPAGEPLLAKARELLHQADRLGPMNTQMQELSLDLAIRSGDLTFAGDRAASWHDREALQRIEALQAAFRGDRSKDG